MSGGFFRFMRWLFWEERSKLRPGHDWSHHDEAVVDLWVSVKVMVKLLPVWRETLPGWISNNYYD
jgi:hypothetical protein